jgi:hypothetical protein
MWSIVAAVAFGPADMPAIRCGSVTGIMTLLCVGSDQKSDPGPVGIRLVVSRTSTSLMRTVRRVRFKASAILANELRMATPAPLTGVSVPHQFTGTSPRYQQLT